MLLAALSPSAFTLAQDPSESETFFAAPESPRQWIAALPPADDADPRGSFDGDLAEIQRRLQQLESARDASRTTDARKPTVKWSGQLQSDVYWFNQSEQSQEAFGDIENGAVIRRARIAMLGDYGPVEYRIEMDFAFAGRPSFLDVYAGVNDVPYAGRVRVGHFFEPFGLERMTPNRFMTFMERALPDQPFSPARNLGVMANNTWLEEHGAWGIGVFRSESDNFGDDVGDNFESAVTGRVTWLPYFDDTCGNYDLIHLGAGYSFRGANNESVRFRAQPEVRLGAAVPNVPFFVDTGAIPADTFELVGLEAAVVDGPLSVQAEYTLVPVHSQPGETLYFHGWYTQVSYFITGEHRPYRKQLGIFDRLTPLRDAVRYSADKQLETGPGAWEIAVRVSNLDLNNGFVRGGRLTDLTVGLNWYLNPYLRFTANYVHAFADDPTIGDTDTDIFATRVGYEF